MSCWFWKELWNLRCRMVTFFYLSFTFFFEHFLQGIMDLMYRIVFSPPARRGLLDFMSVASSCLPPASSSSFRRLLPPAASCRLLPRSPPLCHPRRPRRPRCPRPTAIHSVLCRTSTTTIHAQCPLPDLNHDHPRPVFSAGPQPRPSTPNVPCRTSTASIHAKCSLPDLM